MLVRIIKSPGNSSSGYHLETRSSKIGEDNSFVKDDKTGAPVVIDAAANRSHYKEVTQEQKVAVADFNVIDVVEVVYLRQLLAQFSKDEALRRSGTMIDAARSNIMATANVKELPVQRIRVGVGVLER